MNAYKYEMQGTAADGQTWTTSGTVSVELSGQWPDVVDTAQRESFDQLTSGRAVYGKPGFGCRGPYQVNQFTIERVTN